MEPLNTSAESLNDMEVQKKMEDDHLRLQRQVRMIQVDRQHRSMGVHPQYRRQDTLLRALKAEYDDLTMDLKTARSGAHKKNDKKTKRDLRSSLILMEETEIECEGSSTDSYQYQSSRPQDAGCIALLYGNADALHQILTSSRVTRHFDQMVLSGGVAITEELEGLVQRYMGELIKRKQGATALEGELEARKYQGEARLASAENSLETAMLRFNAVQCENRKIREEIEHMLQDRALFNQSWDKMLAALCKGKKFLQDLFESSTVAYDQRDEWVAKLRSIQEKGKMDQMLQIQEMRDLKKNYDHEMKIYLFLAKKGVIRINPAQQRKEEEQQRRIEEEAQEEYQKHLRLLEEIQEYAGEYNYVKIIEEFELTEQQNFSVYKLMTDRCAENEVLSRELLVLRQFVDDRRDWNEAQEHRRVQKLEAYNQQLEEQRQKTAELRVQLEQREKAVTEAMDKVHDIFKILDCSLEPYQNLLGDKGPSLHRVNLTMCLITSKIQEMIEIAYYFERVLKFRDKSSTSRLKKYLIRVEDRIMFEPYPILYVDPCPSCIETRWMSRVCETPETPFNEEQALAALKDLAADPAYIRSDRVHVLVDCRATASRRLLNTRLVNF